MERNLTRLSNTPYDLLVVGGGIYGVSLARDAALRGLRVGLVEGGDFGHATSFNTLKVIHGGFRYLQHLDIPRMRESIYERMVLMRIAPHLVHPIPFLLPAYGNGMQGKGIMRMALALNDLIGWDRNRLRDPDKYLPRGRVISKSECLRLIPGLSDEDLTGAAIWHDCQLYNSERLVMAVVKDAVKAGADAVNHVEVHGFLRQRNRINGVQAIDQLTGNKLEITAKIVVNAAGPWVHRILELSNGCPDRRRLPLAKAMNLVVNRPLVSKFAVGISSKRKYVDTRAVFNKGHRVFFMVPWHGYTLIGTTQWPFGAEPDRAALTESEVEGFIAEINESYPAARLKREDISFVNWGLLPMNLPNGRAEDVSLLKRYTIYDHEKDDGIEGLISVIGVKFTEARNVAEKAINVLCQKLGGRWPQSRTALAPVDGGEIEQFASFLSGEIAKQPYGLSPLVMRHLVYNYGSSYPLVLKYLHERPNLAEHVSDRSPVIQAEVLHAVRQEMAMTLSDVVRRRTELGLTVRPGDPGLKACADIMGKELAWDEARMHSELEEVGIALSRGT